MQAHKQIYSATKRTLSIQVPVVYNQHRHIFTNYETTKLPESIKNTIAINYNLFYTLKND